MSERSQSSHEQEREAAKLARRAEQTGVTEASLGGFAVDSVEDGPYSRPLTPEEVQAENKAAWRRMLDKDQKDKPLGNSVIGPDGNPLPEGRSVPDPREQKTTDAGDDKPSEPSQLTFED
ncbi:MAG: hypothetical protein WD061_01925 [Candidatus Saccharimonadales bacterium]